MEKLSTFSCASTSSLGPAQIKLFSMFFSCGWQSVSSNGLPQALASFPDQRPHTPSSCVRSGRIIPLSA